VFIQILQVWLSCSSDPDARKNKVLRYFFFDGNALRIQRDTEARCVVGVGRSSKGVDVTEITTGVADGTTVVASGAGVSLAGTLPTMKNISAGEMKRKARIFIIPPLEE